MAIFDKLLLAIDLSPDSDQLLSRVFKICAGHMDRVHVVHVLRGGTLLAVGTLDLRDPEQRQEHDQTLVRLNDILRRNGFQIPPQNLVIRHGEPATEIKRLAHDLETDLVIVGSHNRSEGWMSLPGATTNCVLQGIDSDVMAVRV